MDFQESDIAWHSPAGERLAEFARLLPPRPRLKIAVFGSAPLQLFIDAGFLSADIDIFGDESTTTQLIDFVQNLKQRLSNLRLPE